MMFRRRKEVASKEHSVGSEVNAAHKDISKQSDKTSKSLKRLNNILDDGITFQIKQAMGDHHAK